MGTDVFPESLLFIGSGFPLRCIRLRIQHLEGGVFMYCPSPCFLYGLISSSLKMYTVEGCCGWEIWARPSAEHFEHILTGNFSLSHKGDVIVSVCKHKERIQWPDLGTTLGSQRGLEGNVRQCVMPVTALQRPLGRN